mgnify:CR=1 FL=1
MTPRIFITTAVLKLLIAIAHIIAWWLLMMAMAWGFQQLPAEQYAQGDTISPMFTVLVRTPQGEVLPQRLHNLKSNETLLRQAFSRDDENGRFFSLTPIAPDAFELFVNYDTAQLTQRYRITADNQVVPLSFKSWSTRGMALSCFCCRSRCLRYSNGCCAVGFSGCLCGTAMPRRLIKTIFSNLNP